MVSGNTKQGKKLKREDEQPASRLEKLPRELSLEIVSRLPFLSLIRFMYTSRFCSQLSQEPNLSSRFNDDDPLLIFTTNSLITRYLYFAELIEGNKAVIRKIRTPFNEVKLVASCNGILCLSDYSGTIYIYNPFTKQCKELQKSSRAHSHRDMVLGFGFHPLANEYKILKSLYLRSNGTYISVHTIGVNERTFVLKAPPLFVPEPSQALVNGRLHWSSFPFPSSNGGNFTKKIISFDLLDERFIDIQLPAHGIGEKFSLDVAVLGGFLSGVFTSITANGSFEIWVMKEYEVLESWTRILRVDIRYLIVGTPLYSWLEFDKVVCLLKNEKVLVLYRSGVLVCHDLNGGLNTELVVEWKRHLSQACAHAGSFNWIDTPVNT